MDYFSVRRQISSQTSDELSGWAAQRSEPVITKPEHSGGFIGLFKNLGKSKRPVSDVGPATTPIHGVVAAYN